MNDKNNQQPLLETFTVGWCPHCVRLKEFLARAGLVAVDHDVDVDDEAWQRMLRLTGGVDIVPVVQIGAASRHGAFDAAFATWIRQQVEG